MRSSDFIKFLPNILASLQFNDEKNSILEGGTLVGWLLDGAFLLLLSAFSCVFWCKKDVKAVEKLFDLPIRTLLIHQSFNDKKRYSDSLDSAR
jgi:hypothetical protein